MKKFITLLTIIAAFFVIKSSAQCSAQFTFTVANNTVHFIPAITGDSLTTRHTWSFGDNSFSDMSSPTHTYNTCGSYVVKHVFKYYNPNGIPFCTDSVLTTIQLVCPTTCTVHAAFTAAASATQSNLIQFTNTSTYTPATSTVYCIWNFGDGITATTTGLSNPNHIYAVSGLYNVCLKVITGQTVAGQNCADSICHQMQVQVPTPPVCNLVAAFTSVVDSNRTVHFTNSSTPAAGIDSFYWSFGDGTYSLDANPNHTYANYGNYTVCLKIKKNTPPGTAPCTNTICQTVTLVQPYLCNLVVSFNWQVPPTGLNNMVYFSNTSTPLVATDSVKWTFGDGTTSTEVNPIHVYNNPGIYTVCLRVKKNNTPSGVVPCVREICYTIIVQAPCIAVAAFTSSVDSATRVVSFTNTSSSAYGIDSTYWSFGDGTYSYSSNPVHTYLNPGTYNVCLKVVKNTLPGTPPCTNTICHTVTIPAPICNLIVNYNFYADSTTPNVIHFTNLSAPLAATDSITWTFGDGSISHDVNPVHTYTNAGTFNVCLLVKKNIPGTLTSTCIREKCYTIVIQPICNITANFSWQSSATSPAAISFTNTSSPVNTTASVTWTFGDGTTGAGYTINHNYAQSGVYTVCMRVVVNNTCIREVCKVVTVTIPVVCNLVASFTSVADSNRVVHFTNTSTPAAGIDSFYWSFGDGTYSTNANPNHSYANYGTYTVCLKIKKNMPAGAAPCTNTICQTITLVQPYVCNLVANFTWQSGVSPSGAPVIFFFNTSTPLFANDSVRWTFGDGTSSTSIEPTHTYTSPGSYTVCLRVTKTNTPAGTPPCVREICKTVVVLAPCNLVAAFSSTVDSATRVVNFTNTSTPTTGIDSTYWTFGDGTYSYDVNPVHTYLNPGTYNVCLKIKKNSTAATTPCVSTICHTVIIPTPTCNLVVNYSFFADSITPNVMQFTNLSSPLAATDSINWSFGDGTISHDVNPVHTYLNAGTYTVCLLVKKNIPGTVTAACIREKCYIIVIPPVCNITPNFSWQASTSQPNTINFSNTSTPVNTSAYVTWTFGDNTTGTGYTTNHTYTTAGTYNVCMRVVINNTCIREICHQITVTMPVTCNLVAGFTFSVDSLNVYHFNNTSTPLSPNDSITWTFGDGTSSSLANPTHLYAISGTYIVCLTVKKGSTLVGPACIRQICQTINVVVPQPCNFTVYFSYMADSVLPNKIYFTNLSQAPVNAATATWTFGDGHSSNGWNANHTYTQAGTYNVCLRVATGANCVREYCKQVIVTIACNFPVTYTWRVDTTNNLRVYFNNTSTPASPATATWSFGDGTTTNTWSASHTYNEPGRYYVCLRIQTSANCVRYICDSITVPPVAFNCNNINVSYQYRRDAYMPNKMYFYTISNFPVLSETWTITSLTGAVPPVTLNQYNPVYVFTQAGMYRVCLRAVTLGGCIKEYCNTIVINNVASQCVLTASPNPAINTVTVNPVLTQPATINAYIYNTQNMLVAQKTQQGVIGNNPLTFNISNLVVGNYTIRVYYGNQVCMARFLKF